MKTDNTLILNAIRHSDFFLSVLKDLSLTEQEDLLNKLEVVHLQPGDILFRQGEDSHSLYFLADGFMRFLRELPAGQKEFGKIRVGETVGEIGLLSAMPRPLTVQAINESTLVKLTKHVFDEYFIDHPDALKSILNSLVTRAFHRIDHAATIDKFESMAFVPANPKISLKDFCERLKTALEKYYDPAKIKLFVIAEHEAFDSDEIKKIKMSLCEHYLNIFCVDFKNAIASTFFLDHAERVFVVGDGTRLPGMDWHVQRMLEANLVKQELVLLYPEKMHPRFTSEWITTSRYFRTHQVAQNTEGDYERLARFITGKAVGLVLGGGGTRGWVHVGVLKALMEIDFPIDIIGGTSIGSVVGASYLISQSYETFSEKVEAYAEMNRNLYRITNFTYPVLSILNGKKNTEITKKIFQEIYIENLWKPFFCISCDINKSREYIHTKGLLWEAVRASTAVPAILPPMALHGVVHVDGATINNLPIDVMRKYLDGRGKIIGVDLSYFQDNNYYDFPPEIGFVEAVLLKLGWSTFYNVKFMGLNEILLRAAAVGAKEKLEENASNADVLIRPDLRNYKLLTEVKHAKDLLEIGYAAMKEKLAAGSTHEIRKN